MKTRTIETPSGKGQIYKDGQFLLNVSYDLNVYQQTSILHTTAGSTEVAGNRNIEGTLRGGNFFNLTLDRLTLHLEDGRCLDFMFRHSNGLITGSGDFYSCDEK